MKLKHHYHSPWKRAGFSFLLVLSVMIVGTLGFHHFERLNLIDSFYFMSMIATAQGPAGPLTTNAGKIFTSLISFVSVGVVVASLGFLFGPFLGKLFKVGVEKFEEDIERLKKPR